MIIKLRVKYSWDGSGSDTYVEKRRHKKIWHGDRIFLMMKLTIRVNSYVGISKVCIPVCIVGQEGVWGQTVMALKNSFKVGIRIVLDARDVAFSPSSIAKSSKDLGFCFEY